jgi:hypothetical protein
MSTVETAASGREGLGSAAQTFRNDRWWVEPALTVVGLGLFAAYVTWAAFQGEHYYAEPYLSPFYSPVVVANLDAPGSSPHSLFGSFPSWWPRVLPASPALLVLVFPGIFRFTCYYYRKAYYRSFTGSPPACAVPPAARGIRAYHGESRFLLFQNLHRYALYPAILYIPILYFDAFAAFVKDGQFGVGLGTIVLLVNATLLGGYTFGCHSFRHLIGGGNDCMSCGKATVQYRAWTRASWLNARHMRFAWMSLFWVAFSDIYVRLVSMGVITDPNTWR